MSRSNANWLFYTPIIIAYILLVQPHFPGHSEFIDETLDIAGLLIAIAGLVIRIVARDWKVAHCNGSLVTSGPYSVVRNPMYIGSYLIGLGLCMVIGNLPFSIVFTAAYFAAHAYIVRGEERFLVKAWPEEYPKYQTEVSAWVPSLPALVRELRAHNKWLVSPKIAIKRELLPICGVLIGAVVLEVQEDFVVEGWSHAHTEITVLLCLTAVIVAALAASLKSPTAKSAN